MMDVILGGTLLAAPLAALGWRVWRDRIEKNALTLRAEIHAAVVHALHGESFLSVEVEPRTPWRAGRVLLSAPTGWEWLIEAGWKRIIRLVPHGYEIVIQPSDRAVSGSASRRSALGNAA